MTDPKLPIGQNPNQFSFLAGIHQLNSLLTNNSTNNSVIPSSTPVTNPNQNPIASVAQFYPSIMGGVSSPRILENAAFNLNAYNLMFQHHLKFLQQHRGDQSVIERKVAEQKDSAIGEKSCKAFGGVQTKQSKKGQCFVLKNGTQIFIVEPYFNQPPALFDFRVSMCVSMLKINN